ncbi:MAG: STM3941 family protein [Brumimicrobium sp.]
MNSGRTEIYGSKKKTLILILKVSIIFPLAIFVLVISDGQEYMPSLLAKIAAYGLIFIFISLSLFHLYKLSENSPRIILDSDGITDNTTIASPGHIPWREIRELDVKTIYSTPLLGIALKDPESFQKPSNFVSRFWLSLNNRISSSFYMITTNNLDIDFDEFAEMARAYHQKYSG